MTTATLTRTTGDTPSRTAGATPDRDRAVRRLRELHAHAGQLVAGADWTPDVERAVHDLSVEIRRTVDELSGTPGSVASTLLPSTLMPSTFVSSAFVPSTPGDGTPPVVRFRELGVLHRRLTEVLHGPVDPERVHRASARASALVAVLAGTLA